MFLFSFLFSFPLDGPGNISLRSTVNVRYFFFSFLLFLFSIVMTYTLISLASYIECVLYRALAKSVSFFFFFWSSGVDSGGLCFFLFPHDTDGTHEFFFLFLFSAVAFSFPSYSYLFYLAV